MHDARGTTSSPRPKPFLICVGPAGERTGGTGTLLVLSPSEVRVHDRGFHYVVRLSLRFTPRDHQRDVILRFAAAELLDRRYDRLQKRWHRQMVMGSQGLKQAALAKLLAVRAAASVTPSVYNTKISPGESCTSTTSHRQSSNRPGTAQVASNRSTAASLG